jgi:hypothetical protein
LEFLPVTPEIAQQAGELRRGWEKKGHTLSFTDVNHRGGCAETERGSSIP